MSGKADGHTAPLVSIITANFNNARHLSAAIESVRRQTLTSWELVLVDDASTDASVEVARRAAAGDGRIRVVVQGVNQGPGAARNRALDLARGQWVAVFDGDDLMAPDRLQRLVERAAADGAYLVADDLVLFSEADARRTHYLPARLRRAPTWINLARFIDSNRLYAPLPDLGYLKPLIAADLIRQTGVRYDEGLRIGEDYDFLTRLMAAGHDLRIEPAGLYQYRRHAGSTSHRSYAADIEGQMAADQRFLASVRPLDAREAAAFHRRRRSLRSMILYDEVITRLKRRAITGALAQIVRQPRIWPLLARPLIARARRLAKAAARKFAATPAPSATPGLRAERPAP